MIYLDNAATTMHKPPCVVRAVTEALESLGNCGPGGKRGVPVRGPGHLRRPGEAGGIFGRPEPGRVCFTSNSTEALNTAIFGLLGPEDHVISTDLEHNSVLRPLYRLEEAGMGLDFLAADRQGNIDYDQLPRLLRPNTRAIVCTHASNLTGNTLDLPRLGAFAREHGLLFVVDASQSAGSLPLDMTAYGISVLCFTGHKGLMGPQGTGGLCVAPGVEIRPLKTGGTGVQSHRKDQPEAYPTRLEAGTLNGHGIAGLSAALDWIRDTGRPAIPPLGNPADGAVLPGREGRARRHGLRGLHPGAGSHRGPEHWGHGLQPGRRHPLVGVRHRRALRGPLRPPDASGPGHHPAGGCPLFLRLV